MDFVLYGMEGVPKKNYEKLEYKKRIEKAAADLFAKAKKLSWTNFHTIWEFMHNIKQIAIESIFLKVIMTRTRSYSHGCNS